MLLRYHINQPVFWATTPTRYIILCRHYVWTRLLLRSLQQCPYQYSPDAYRTPAQSVMHFPKSHAFIIPHAPQLEPKASAFFTNKHTSRTFGTFAPYDHSYLAQSLPIFNHVLRSLSKASPSTTTGYYKSLSHSFRSSPCTTHMSSQPTLCLFHYEPPPARIFHESREFSVWR